MKCCVRWSRQSNLKLFGRYLLRKKMIRGKSALTFPARPTCHASGSIQSLFFRVAGSSVASTKKQDDINNSQNVSATHRPNEDVLNFNDTTRAYRSKTTREITRALFVFKLCSVNYLVDHNLQVCILLYIYTVAWTPVIYFGHVLEFV